MKPCSATRIKALLACLALVGLTISSPGFAVTDAEALPRLVQLSQTPGQASIDEVLSIAQEPTTNELRQQFVFTALIQLGPSTGGDEYAKSVLDNPASAPFNLRGALGYLAEHAQPWMAPYAEQYLAASYPGEVRTVAAYLAGQLGLQAQRDSVIAVVNNADYGEWRRLAAFGLAYLTDATEFQTVIEPSSLNIYEKRLVTQYSEFILADETVKEANISSLLRSSYIELQLAGLRYIVANNKTDLVLGYLIATAVGDEQLMTVTDPKYQLLLRILGYEITGDINNILINQRALL